MFAKLLISLSQPWWVSEVGSINVGYAEGAGSIPGLGTVRHSVPIYRVLSGLQSQQLYLYN
jgi:hypothetical protein